MEKDHSFPEKKEHNGQSSLLDELYKKDEAAVLAKVYPDEACSAQAIYEVQDQVSNKYVTLNPDSLSDALEYSRLQKILNFAPMIRAIATQQITLQQAMGLTKAQIDLIREREFKITEVARLPPYRVQALSRGLNSATALDPRFLESDYRKINFDWMKPDELAHLTLDAIKLEEVLSEKCCILL